MDAILGQTTAHGRRQKLRTMTEGLDLKDFYGATIERIKKQGGEKTRLGMAALMWVCHSERLLQLNELLDALAVEIGSADLNGENIPSVETLLSCCLGLLVVDGGASAVRLVHFSLQEYLNTLPDIFGPTHSIMAETCLTYLNFRTIKDILSIPKVAAWERFFRFQSTPFLEYSSLYWGVHARRETSKGVVSLALQLFSQIETHISTKLLLEDASRKSGRWYQDIPAEGPLIGFTGLHCVSIFGIAEIATSLMDQPNCDLNKRDILSITPLIWAAINGQEEVARLLLGRQTVNPDKLDRDLRRTALSWAAVMGHERIVRLLLERASTNPDGTDGWWGRTPQAVKKVWGRRYVNPNKPDRHGQTPILLAAEEGHEGVVKLLLRRKDVNLHTPGGYGVTLLMCAAHSGRDGIMKLLLERADFNTNIQDSEGHTPLAIAAVSGRDEVVKLLLGREDVNPDMPDNYGRTPLLRAAQSGRNEVVKLLLGREDVNPDMPDKYGRTPLSWATQWERSGVMKLLLGQEGASPDIPDNRGRTPLSWAAENGSDGAVESLLGQEGVNPDMPDKRGRTPLSWAAENGNDGAVELLLRQEGVNPDMPDDGGRIPLSWAAEKGHGRAMELLLGRDGINPGIPDNDSQTPLSWSARRGRDGVDQPLLERANVDPDIPNKYGTPLSLASMRWHKRVVKLLQARKSTNSNPA